MYFRGVVVKKIYLLTLIVLAFMLGGCGEDSKTQEVKQGMEAYLKRNYEMEFEVGKPYLTGNKGFGYFYQVKAFPKGKPELEFFVEGDKSNSGVYVDNYLQVLWTSQGRKEVEAKIREVYGKDIDFILHYNFAYHNKNFKDLDHSEVLAKCNGRAYIEISFDIFGDTQIDKELEAQKAFQVMKPYLLDNNIARYHFNVIFLAKDFKEEYFRNPPNDSYGKSFDELYKEKKLINFLKTYNLEQTHPIEVKDSKDLIQWFKY